MTAFTIAIVLMVAFSLLHPLAGIPFALAALGLALEDPEHADARRRNR